jgi:hypothetical protein
VIGEHDAADARSAKDTERRKCMLCTFMCTEKEKTK